MSRRELLKKGGLSLGVLGLGYAAGVGLPSSGQEYEPYGPLVKDPNRILDLPAGFRYVVLSRAGDIMDDGLVVPPLPDGMAAFGGPQGRTILVRNHELRLGRGGAYAARKGKRGRAVKERMFDTGLCLGGTTTLVIASGTLRLERQFLSLAGTLGNCGGGATPWGTWISCEEYPVPAGYRDATRKAHGWCFEVPATAEQKLHQAVPLEAMGRFNHEAIAVDPRTGIVYQTEDRGNGLIYRFIPERPKDLIRGGRLQALVVRDAPGLDTGNHGSRAVRFNDPLAVSWIDIRNVESPQDDLRRQGHAAGAATFSRGEGMAYDDGAIHFTCTSGGRFRKGQVWTYTPDPQENVLESGARAGTLKLRVEPDDPNALENPDNLTVTPFGHLILCEDGPGTQHLVGVTPRGRTYKLARNALNDSEFAGATFSPDGSTLFVNIYRPGATLAITGSWETRDEG